MSETKYTYAVYDLETTTKSDVGFAASPHHPKNYVVLGGYLLPDGTTHQTYGDAMFPLNAKLIVGANLRFDLEWAARSYATTPAFLAKGKRIWDVCLVEYLLRRQRVRMPSLEQCAQLRGIAARKEASVSEAIKNGVCPSTIPSDELKKYHAQDLKLTHEVFLSQFAEAKERGMLPLIWSQMEALVATTEMGFNGVRIDTDALTDYRENLLHDQRKSEEAFCEALLDAGKASTSVALYVNLYGHLSASEIMGSNKFLSLIFFGGNLKYEETEAVGTYKNGKTKYKKVEKIHRLCSTDGPLEHGAELTKLGYYTVDDSVLKSIESRGSLKNVAKAVREYRTATKQLTTYIDGVTKNMWPDGKVHCSFNHNVTLTGRLSCSAPNLQNQTDGEIKRCYIPTDEYTFIEFDYSQLEVVGLAVLSGDTQLLEDIRSGTDIHTALYQDMYHKTPTAAERKAFKPLTFGLIYGAGANTMAENSGLSLAEARKFIITFYRRYPGVQTYHHRMLDDAKKGRIATSDKTEGGLPRGKYIHRMPTGREYEFVEYDPPGTWSTAPNFSPTELKNWPIQGWSTGDVVPLMIGHVVRELTASKWYGKIRPLVTVHDSILFEVPTLDLTEARNYLVELMSKTRQVIEAQFGYDIGIELKTENKTGDNWKDMYA